MSGDQERGGIEQVGAAVGRAADRVVDSAGSALSSLVSLPGLRAGGQRRARPGTAAGLDRGVEGHTPPEPGEIQFRVVDYDADSHEEQSYSSAAELLETPPPPPGVVRWVDVTGLNAHVVDQLRGAFGFHTLAAEDVLHVPQRPRMEPYPGHVFITARMLQLDGGALHAEQVSLFLFDHLVLSFQESPKDVWDPIRARLRKPSSRVRGKDASFLAYALLDAIVDHGFPLLEHYGEIFEDLEAEIMEEPDPSQLRRVQGIRRELGMLRRTLWPTRELVDGLMRSEEVDLPEITRTYLRDVHGHAVQLIDVVEVYRELCGTLSDLYMSAVSNRMNEVMKTLTVIATIFIPMTFLAGVYGMNFKYLPELNWPWAYAAFWVVCMSITAGLLYYFRRKKWL